MRGLPKRTVNDLLDLADAVRRELREVRRRRASASSCSCRLAVVTAEEAAALPAGSRVVHTGYYDELPEPGARVAAIGHGYRFEPVPAPRKYVVLHRAQPADGTGGGRRV